MWPAETTLFNMGLNHAQCDTLTLRYNEQAWGQKNSKDTSILSAIYYYYYVITIRDQQLEYESWGFIEVNFRRQQDRRGRNLQIEYAKCGVQIEYDST